MKTDKEIRDLGKGYHEGYIDALQDMKKVVLEIINQYIDLQEKPLEEIYINRQEKSL